MGVFGTANESMGGIPLMSILFPDSKAPRTAQYKKAWADLSSSNRNEKAHAKCWLTYRAVDGEINLDDWSQHIAIHDLPGIGTRWRVSQATAEFFLWVLNGCHEKMEEAARIVENAPIMDWPDGLAHYCRVKSILALMQLIGGKHDECRATIESSVDYWQTHMGAFDYKTHANRFLELRYDVHAVNFMIWIGLELNFIKPNDALKGWITASLKTQKQTPWWRCIEKTMDGVTGMWLPTLRYPHKTDSEISTRYDLTRKLFDGVGAELGVAAGVFSKTILVNENVTLLYSIDRWSDHHDFKEYRRVLDNLAEFEHRSIVLRASFDEALTIFPDDYLHWIYIDGYAHTGQENGKTLDDWYPKLQPGGIFAGHDYSTKFPQTVEAVDAFMRKHDLPLYLTTGDTHQSWWTRKPI